MINAIIVSSPPPVTVVQEIVEINVIPPVTGGSSTTFNPFKFIATQGQSQFTLVTTPTLVVYLAINGIIQSQLNGDFTVSVATITLSDSVDAGDIIAGVYV